MSALTEKQSAVLAFIKSFIADKGFPPSRTEISEHFGWSSPNAAQDHLRALQEKGTIKLTSSLSRGISVIAQPQRGLIGGLPIGRVK